jgi:P4 family phage/plasmid primase-like protien
MNKSDFEDFLNKYRLEFKSPEKPTHTLLGVINEKRGSFKIPDEDMDKFYYNYEKYTFVAKNRCYMTERPLKGAGILKFDFDILFTSKEHTNKRKYTVEDTHILIGAIQSILREILDRDTPEESFFAFLFLRPAPYVKEITKNNETGETKNSVKDGIHIMFPYLYLNYRVHHYVCKRLCAICREKNLRDVFYFENEYTDFIDTSVIENSGWLMYGSTKQGVRPYEMVGVFNIGLKQIYNETIGPFTDLELTKLLSIRNVLPETKTNDFYQKSAIELFLDSGKRGNKRKTVSVETEGGDGYGGQAQAQAQAKTQAQAQAPGLPEKSGAPRKKKNTENSTDTHLALIDSDIMREVDYSFLESDENRNGRNVQESRRIGIYKIVSLLSPKRALNYQDWLQVGLCLHNLGEYFDLWKCFSKQNFDTIFMEESCDHPNDMIEFQKIYETLLPKKREAEAEILEKYVRPFGDNALWEKSCFEKWGQFKKKDIGASLHYGSLLYWAKNDSPEAYKSLLNTQTSNMVREAVVNPSHKKIASILYKKYQGQFVCSDYEKGVWYEWTDHCWRRMDGVSSIRKKITGTFTEKCCLRTDFENIKNEIVEDKLLNNQDLSTMKEKIIELKKMLDPKQAELFEFKNKYGFNAKVPELEKMVKDLSASLKSTKDEYEKLSKEIKKTYIRPYDDVISRFLETTIAIDNIVKEAKTEFFDASFMRKMNANPLLFLFKNGVYDLETMKFRQGIPSDYIAIENHSEQVNYREFDLDTCADIQEIENYFRQVIVDEEKRMFFLTLVASCLEGHNTNNIFPILTGSGSNAKSLTVGFIEDCFGMYSGKLNPAFLTQKRNKSNSASPEYYSIVDCRFVSSEESDTSDELNTAIIKEITGNSKITSRTLFQAKMTTKTPQFIPFLICNDLPNIKSMDGGTWRRIVVISFDSKFVDDPSKSDFAHLKNVFLVDRNIKNKMSRWVEPFMYLLIQKYYRLYLENQRNLIIPSCVRAFTDKYKDENDMLAPFIEAFIVNTGNKTDSVRIKDLYNRVLLWFRDNFQGEKEPTMTTVKKYFEQKFGNYDSIRGWVGKLLADI